MVFSLPAWSAPIKVSDAILLDPGSARIDNAPDKMLMGRQALNRCLRHLGDSNG